MTETKSQSAGARTHEKGCMGNYDYRDCTCGATQPNQKRAQHTPGPWSISGETYPIGILCGDKGDPQIVAQIGGDIMSVEDDEECQANARLIAAAPELLLRLKELLELADRCIDRRVWAQLDRAETAIAKAEGR